MKKKKLIILFIVILIILTGCKKEVEEKDLTKYKEMEKRIFEAANKEIIASNYKGYGGASASSLIANGYLKASDILDEDGSQCKANVILENSYDKKCIEVYLKCHDYVTEGYGKLQSDSCQNIREYDETEIKISKINIVESRPSEKEILEFETYRQSKAKLYYYNISKVEVTDTENNTYNLKELIETKKLSMEGLKVYFESLAKEEKVIKQILDDGRPKDGTRVYRNDDYTIIMCNNAYWFEDVYIGPTSMSYYSKFKNRNICE